MVQNYFRCTCYCLFPFIWLITRWIRTTVLVQKFIRTFDVFFIRSTNEFFILAFYLTFLITLWHHSSMKWPLSDNWSRYSGSLFHETPLHGRVNQKKCITCPWRLVSWTSEAKKISLFQGRMRFTIFAVLGIFRFFMILLFYKKSFI